MTFHNQEAEFNLLAIAENEPTREFHAIIEFRDIDGKMRKVSIPLEDLKHTKTLEKAFTKVGAFFSRSDDKNKVGSKAFVRMRVALFVGNMCPRSGGTKTVKFSFCRER